MASLSHREKTKKVWSILFILPSFLILFLFVVYPLGYTFFLSLCKYNFSYDQKPDFYGLGNFVDMFKDLQFRSALGTTIHFAVWDFMLMMGCSLLLALMLFFKGEHTWFFRTAIFAPIVIPASLVCIVFSWLLAENFGLFNKFLGNVLGHPSWTKAWLTNAKTALGCMVVVNLWCNIGFETILFLSGLQGISQDYLEAADIDGATGLKKITRIILPNLKQTYIITGIWATVATLKVFVEPSVMTNGGPGRATTVLYLYIYNNAFKYWELGYSSSMAFFLSIIILLISLVQFILNNREA
ncbi:MAG: sugar ABC transporter permease [Sphaerochaetaceae bacterium]